MSRYHDDPAYREEVKRKARERYQNDPDYRDEKRKKVRNRHAILMATNEKYREESIARIQALKDRGEDPEKRKIRNKKSRKKREAWETAESVKLFQELLYAYSTFCTCCGEDNIVFLTIDHINGGGKKHRKEMRNSRYKLYTDIKREGYPLDKYRILCMNCNWATWKVGICPHQHEVRKIIYPSV